MPFGDFFQHLLIRLETSRMRGTDEFETLMIDSCFSSIPKCSRDRERIDCKPNSWMGIEGEVVSCLYENEIDCLSIRNSKDP